MVISEIAYHPSQGPEYLVLSNSSDQVVPLYDPAVPANSWQVTGIGDNGGPFVLPQQTSLQPHESVVLTADPAAFTATYPVLKQRIFGPFMGKLNNDGERIVLQAPQPPEINGDVAYADMDVVDYGAAAPWPPSTIQARHLCAATCDNMATILLTGEPLPADCARCYSLCCH